MPFVLFFRGMIAVLVVFAATIYLLTGSFWTAAWQTIACAVLIQIGYFLAVLFMVWRSNGRPAQRGMSRGEADPMLRSDDAAVDGAAELPAAPLSRRR